jgi:hypothetical protein
VGRIFAGSFFKVTAELTAFVIDALVPGVGSLNPAAFARGDTVTAATRTGMATRTNCRAR